MARAKNKEEKKIATKEAVRGSVPLSLNRSSIFLPLDLDKYPSVEKTAMPPTTLIVASHVATMIASLIRGTPLRSVVSIWNNGCENESDFAYTEAIMTSLVERR